MLLLLLLLLLPSSIHAAITTVNSLAALNAAAAVAKPGDTIQLTAGRYLASGSLRDVVTLSANGTAAAPIVLQPAPGAVVRILGRGFSDLDSNKDGLADGPKVNGEVVIRITGQHWRMQGIDVSLSGRYGVEIDADHCVVTNTTVHDNWDAGILLNGSDITTSYNESFRNRHGSGILMRPMTAGKVLTGNSVNYNLLDWNGYDVTGARVLPATGDSSGGGNSDGFTVFKGCFDPATSTQYCTKHEVVGNVVFHNADDGIDVSFGDSIVRDNISMNNSAPGDGPNAYKVFQHVSGLVYVNNIGLTGLVGFDLRVDKLTVLHNTMLYAADPTTGNGLKLFFPASVAQARNNLAAFNTKYDLINFALCPQCDHNWSGDGTAPLGWRGNPLLTNATLWQNNGAFSVPLTTGSIKQKVQWYHSQVRSALALTAGSPAKGKAAPLVTYTDPHSGKVITLNAADPGVFPVSVP